MNFSFIRNLFSDFQSAQSTLQNLHNQRENLKVKGELSLNELIKKIGINFMITIKNNTQKNPKCFGLLLS